MTTHAARAALPPVAEQLAELTARQHAEAALLTCDRFASAAAVERAITRMAARRERIRRLARECGRAGG